MPRKSIARAFAAVAALAIAALLWLLARELARPSSAELGELVGLFLS